ncbi:hypothetical protein BU15DRAFT_72722 [Melanogaster broomeanus]|nr:hypothetical protein BU15DRAFT_72722 [Melanogaster broomeanus]
MSRSAPQRLLPFLRSTIRAKAVTRTASRTAFGRRMISTSDPHSWHKTGSDSPWIIGSALVFGPAYLQFLYLISPSARKSPHGHASHEHKSHHDEHADAVPEPVQETPSMTDDEGAKVSGEDIKESPQNSSEADPPKTLKNTELASSQPESSTEDKTDNVPEEAAPVPSELPRIQEAKSDEPST